MRGFGSNQAQFAMEGVMDILAERVGVDGWDIRDRNILNPGDAFGTGQIMRESVARHPRDARGGQGRLQEREVQGHRLRHQEHRPRQRHDRRRLHRDPRGRAAAALEILNGYTEMGQGVYTATMQAVCEETGLPADIMTIRWDKELGEKCGETWASRATTLSCAAAQRAAQKAGRGLEDDRRLRREARLGREYYGECVYNFTTRPGTPEAVLNPTTHLTFSYAAQVVILDEDGALERVLVANDVGRAINPRLCAEQMEGGVHMGLGYALSENFTSTNGGPDSLALRDLGIVRAKHMPPVDVILIEVPDEVGGYGAKGVGEIGCVATAGAVAGALHSYDGIRRFRLPMDDAPAAAPLLPKARQKVRDSAKSQSRQSKFKAASRLDFSNFVTLHFELSYNRPMSLLSPSPIPSSPTSIPRARCCRRSAPTLQLAPQADAGGDPEDRGRRRCAARDLREDHGRHDRADEALPDHLALRHRRRQRRPRRGDRRAASSSRRCRTTASTKSPIMRWRCCWRAARKIPLSNAQVHAGRWEMQAVVPIHRLRGTRARAGRASAGFRSSSRRRRRRSACSVIAYDPFVPR